MKLNEYGSPVSPQIGVEKLPEKVHHPTRVKDHPEWKNDAKPWGDYIHKTQHSSIECHYLYKKVLELGVGNYANLGVFRGGSLLCFAHGLKEVGGGKVYGVDLFNNMNGGETPEAIDKIFKKRGVSKYVEYCTGYTHEWPEQLNHLKFKFIFIDADHYYETCKQDFELWAPLLEEGGQISFHDCNISAVDKVLEEISEEWELVEHVATIKTFERKK